MSEYRSQVDGRRMQREMAASPGRVRAVPLAEEAEFERTMAQLSNGQPRGGQPHASGLGHGEEWGQLLKEAREEKQRRGQDAPRDASRGQAGGTARGLSAWPFGPSPDVAELRERDEALEREDEALDQALDAQAELQPGADARVDIDIDLVEPRLDNAPAPREASPRAPVSSCGRDAAERWRDMREEALEDEAEERWLDPQGECFETALELVEALHLDLAERPAGGQGDAGGDDGRHANDLDAWLEATFDVGGADPSLCAAAAEGMAAEGGGEAPIAAPGAPLDELPGAGAVPWVDAADDGESGRRDRHGHADAAEAAAELLAPGRSHARDAAHLLDTRDVHAAPDVQTGHDLGVDVGDFSLRERVYGAVHAFEVVSRGSPVRSVELVRHADGQMTANVSVDAAYAGGMAEFLERLRSRMGRLRLNLLRLMVDQRTVAELRPERGDAP